MLASAPVHAAGERVGGAGSAAAAAAAALAFCAVFFANGYDQATIVWIGALALAAAAIPAAAAWLGLAPPFAVDRYGAAFLGCVLGLAVWMGISTLWSLSPDRSWGYTNLTLVDAAFALAGVVLGAWLPRPALAGVRAAAVLLGLLFGWALLAKCVPALYSDYGRVARLRAPLGYWNELALLGAVAVPVALWLAAPRAHRLASRVAGVVLLYGAVVVTLLTYSRVGVVLAALAAAAWIVLCDERIESLAAVGLAALLGGGVFGVALALPGITKDGQPRSVRSHDGWLFALAVLLGVAVVAGAALALARLAERRPLSERRRRRVERAAAVVALALVVAGVAASAAFAHRIWSEFANPVTSQIGSGSGSRLGSLSSSNRWRWWTEEWSAFTGHPGGGTGAGTFQLTDLRLRQSNLVTTTEPHNTPLQFLGELGIVGLLLYLGAAAAGIAGVVAARRRADSERTAVTALGLALGVFLLHTVVDMDWDFVATCGPLLLVAGLVLGRRGSGAPVRRPLVAVAAVLVALGGVYSLAAPWLAQRSLAAANFRQAHSYDPLSIEALSGWAAEEDAAGNTPHALQLYREEVALEPENGSTWYDLGSFYYEHGAWTQAYAALSKAWTYDRYGPAGVPCGLLDRARHKALGVWPPSCPRGPRPAASP